MPLPQTQMPGPPAGPQVQPVVNPYDLSTDPILQRIQAIGQRRVADAEAQSLAARRQLAIDSGDESLAPDEATALAARNNPNSLAAQFRKKSHDAPIALTADQSKQNIGYASAGATQQSDLSNALMGEQSQMQQQTRGQLSAIEEALRAARSGAQDEYTQGQGEAAQRLQDRLGDTPVGYQRPQSARAIPGIGRLNLGGMLRRRPPPRARAAPARLPHHQP